MMVRDHILSGFLVERDHTLPPRYELNLVILLLLCRGVSLCEQLRWTGIDGRVPLNLHVVLVSTGHSAVLER